ncbi:MAG: hypothetical protein IJ124_00560 [Clostridia bacterium]|nr:hypothetical protein [Clostridia bacterium]
MNKRARSHIRAPLWPRIAALAVIAVLALLAVVFTVRLFSGALRLARTDGGATEQDPQFAQSADTVTRPPELMGESGMATTSEDPSAHWDLGVQTPVDKTAEELSREASGQP